jgi:TonB family protein
MTALEIRTNRQNPNAPVCVSTACHLLFLIVLLAHRPAPVFVTPVSVAQGNGKSSYYLVYLAPYGHQDSDSTEHVPVTTNHSSRTAPAARVERRRPAPVNLRKGNSPDQYARAGTRYGSLLTGPTEGPEIKPALPVVFPDPPVTRSELPDGLEGDVIVEITIDTTGKVIDMKLLQSIGRAIDEKVMATLRNWQFRPATMDDVPIVSKHDVHFHYPS